MLVLQRVAVVIESVEPRELSRSDPRSGRMLTELVEHCNDGVSLGALKPATRGRVQNQQVNGRLANDYSAERYS